METKCAYCERAFGFAYTNSNKAIKPSRDHVYPKSKGGAKHKSNIVIVCEQCNKFKNDLTPDDFILKIDKMIDLRQGNHFLSIDQLKTVRNNFIKIIEQTKPSPLDEVIENFDPSKYVIFKKETKRFTDEDLIIKLESKDRFKEWIEKWENTPTPFFHYADIDLGNSFDKLKSTL